MGLVLFYLQLPALNLSGTATINGQLKLADGVVVTVTGALTVTDSSQAKTGTITGGATCTGGGGVYVSGGSFTLESGSISGNVAQNDTADDLALDYYVEDAAEFKGAVLVTAAPDAPIGLRFAPRDTDIAFPNAVLAVPVTVTWLNDNGDSLGSGVVPYGTVPSHDAPVRANTEEYTYTFAGWSDGDNTYAADQLPPATGDPIVVLPTAPASDVLVVATFSVMTGNGLYENRPPFSGTVPADMFLSGGTVTLTGVSNSDDTTTFTFTTVPSGYENPAGDLAYTANWTAAPTAVTLSATAQADDVAISPAHIAITPAGTLYSGDTVNDGTATVVSYTGKEETVIVPASFGFDPVYAVAKGAFADNPHVKVIYLPGTVRVEYGAFSLGQKTPGGAIFNVEKTSEGTDVEIFCAGPGGAVWCAAYDGDGRMLGVESQPVTDGQSVYRFSFGTENTVRAFLLDADWQPLCESETK